MKYWTSTSCLKNQRLFARKKCPASGLSGFLLCGLRGTITNQRLLARKMPRTRIYRFVLCGRWGTLKNWRLLARKICPSPGFIDFLCRLWGKVLVNKNNSGKNYLSGKKSSVFQARTTGLVLLAWKIEDSLPEKMSRIRSKVYIDFSCVAYEEP